MSHDQLNDLLNTAKRTVFIQKKAVFLGTLLCQCPVVFASKHEDGKAIQTAETDGNTIWWNPEWFQQLPAQTRPTILLHELWHIAFLHMVRLNGRDPYYWNIACDIAINNMLMEQGHSFDGVSPWFDPQYKDMTADHIYDEIMKNPPPKGGTGSWGEPLQPGSTGDMNMGDSGDGELTPEQVASLVKKVQQASAAATMIGGQDAGDLPGDVEDFIKKFFKPKVNWVSELSQFVIQVMSSRLSWKRPNRRHEDIYLPSKDTEDKVMNIFCYNDCSASVTEEMLRRLTSEMKHIWENLKPDELRIINFDTKIQSETIYSRENGDETIDKIKIVGRGGTSLKCVYNHIQQHKPNLVIVFSDLYCPVMPEWKGCPILWLCIDNPRATVMSGRLIHVEV